MNAASVYLSNKDFFSNTHPEEILEIIEDIEQGLYINKSLIKEIIYSKRNNQNSEETDQNLFVASKSLELINNENSRLIYSINKMNEEISNADTLIAITKERFKGNRIRRKQSKLKLQDELRLIKDSIQKKEEKIKDLEEYSNNIENLLKQRLKHSGINPAQIITQGKLLINKVSKKLESAKITHSIEERKCREIENEIKSLQSFGKISSPILKTTDKIIKQKYSLNLNYENFWFVNPKNEEKNVEKDKYSNSDISSDSSPENQKFSSNFTFTSKLDKKMPELQYFTSGPKKKISDEKLLEININKLELAYQIKCEEEHSLIKVLNDLEAIEYSLTRLLKNE